MAVSLAFLFSSSGLYAIDAALDDEKYIYFTLGSVSIVFGLFLIYGIKDII